MKRAIIGAALLLLIASVGDALAHRGNTNAYGCHTVHRTGDYHCHEAKSPSPGRVIYCHVVRGENRCGYARSTCRRLVEKFGGHCEKE